MTTKEWAILLNGREYTEEMTKSDEEQAKEDGVVIVFGASDDLLEFRGIIDDEVGAWEGTTVQLTPNAKVYNEEENINTLEYNRYQVNKIPKVESIWCPKNENNEIWSSWEIRSEIPHETFDIMEDDSIYCRGIVFRWEDAKNFMV